MPDLQLQLFDEPKPLLDRFGDGLFRAAPRRPGVYVMTGADGRVLYIGQSGNLRQRLASYKNARPGRVRPNWSAAGSIVSSKSGVSQMSQRGPTDQPP